MMRPMAEMVKISRSPEVAADFRRQLAQMYRRGKCCDLRIVCGDDLDGVGAHRLVLASLSQCLTSAFRSEDQDDVVHLPDFQVEQVKLFLDGIYQALEENPADEVVNFSHSSDVVKALGIDLRLG